MMKQILAFSLFPVLLGLFVPQLSWSSPAPWTVDLDHGTGNVEFRATGHPTALHIIGKGGAPRGNFVVTGTAITGTALFDLTSLDTGISMRTRHMKEKYLETEKFHDAKLTLVKMSLPPEATQDHFTFDQVPFTGKLLLHETGLGIGLLACGLAGGAVIYFDLSQRGWSAVIE